MIVDTSLREAKVVLCDPSGEHTLAIESMLDEAGLVDVTTLAEAGALGAALAAEGDCDLCVLTVEAPPPEGLELLRTVHRLQPWMRAVPVLVLVACEIVEVRRAALELGAAAVLPMPFERTEMALRVRNLLRLRHAYLAQRRQAGQLEARLREHTDELTRATDDFVVELAKVCEHRAGEPDRHIMRVGKFAHLLAEASGLHTETCFMIERAAALHDVGNIDVAEDILVKPGTLSAEETRHMREHARRGGQMLAEHDSRLMQMAATIARAHHERWDGTGYPEGLRGEAIPIEARITAICDVFDALTSQRPYKHPWSVHDALEYLVSQAGQHFDPALVELFVRHVDEVETIRSACA